MDQRPFPTSEFDDEIIDFRYYLLLLRTVLYKHYKKIFLFSLFCVFASVLIAQSMAPSFVATVTLNIAPRDSGVFNSASYWWERNDPAFQTTQVGILSSHKLVRRVVERLDLHNAEILHPQPAFAQFIAEWMPGLSDKHELPVSDSLRIENTAMMLSGAISVKMPSAREQSYLIGVSVRLPDPQLAAQAANTLAEVYMQEVFNTEIDKALKNQSWLTERLAVLKEDLRISEQQLQQYRESENIVARSSGQGELDQELELVSARYFKAREDRLLLENLYEQVRNIQSTGTDFENIPAVMSNPLVQNLNNTIFNLQQRKSELSKRYGSRHNKMIALESELAAARKSLSSQVSNVIEGIKNDFQVAQKSEQSLEQTLAAARGKKQSLGRKEFKLRELEQEVESKRTVYSAFLRKLNEDDASGPIQNTNVWVTDPATVPQTASGRSMKSIVLVAFILSLMAGVGLGILLELIDNTFKSPEDVEQKLGMEVLGVLPLISEHQIDDQEIENIGHHYYARQSTSTFAEAVRSLRTTLALLTINRPSKRLLITSSMKGEGKTSVALSLAASFGATSKVLLIDADFRRPSVLRTRDANSNQKLGLSDVLAGVTSVEECLIHSDEANVDILTAGRISPNPLELLGSAEFNALLNAQSELYDKIIIDSAPCLPVSDSYLLSAQVDSVIVVVKAASTIVSNVRTVLKRFASLNVEVTGVLLNYVNFDAKYNTYKYAGYYDYHGYSGSEEDILKH